MTEFWREGFWRHSVNGTLHWVEGHIVYRDDWSRYSQGPSEADRYRTLLEDARVRTATSRFVNPNASCPICGAAVFFYQNEYGSRVFFDELGPPWPKHPCTDNPATATPRQDVALRAEEIHPVGRGETDIIQIVSWQVALATSSNEGFEAAYGASPWTMAKIVKETLNKSPVALS